MIWSKFEAKYISGKDGLLWLNKIRIDAIWSGYAKQLSASNKARVMTPVRFRPPLTFYSVIRICVRHVCGSFRSRITNLIVNDERRIVLMKTYTKYVAFGRRVYWYYISEWSLSMEIIIKYENNIFSRYENSLDISQFRNFRMISEWISYADCSTLSLA